MSIQTWWKLKRFKNSQVCFISWNFKTFYKVHKLILPHSINYKNLLWLNLLYWFQSYKLSIHMRINSDWVIWCWSQHINSFPFTSFKFRYLMYLPFGRSLAEKMRKDAFTSQNNKFKSLTDLSQNGLNA